ncbi:MAG: hypothetical protein ACRDTM_14430, partial [Micromonosporaceae bacterium]
DHGDDHVLHAPILPCVRSRPSATPRFAHADVPEVVIGDTAERPACPPALSLLASPRGQNTDRPVTVVKWASADR